MNHVLLPDIYVLSVYESLGRVTRDVIVFYKTELLFALLSAQVDWHKGELRNIKVRVSVAQWKKRHCQHQHQNHVDRCQLHVCVSGIER